MIHMLGTFEKWVNKLPTRRRSKDMVMGDHDPSDDETASFDLGNWLKNYQPARG